MSLPLSLPGKTKVKIKAKTKKVGFDLRISES